MNNFATPDSRTVVDNFLDSADHERILNLLYPKFNKFNKRAFPWYYSNGVWSNGENDGFYFTHPIFDFVPCTEFFDVFMPIIKKLSVKALVRAKANFYPNTSTLVKHNWHTDQDFDVKSLLYFVNSNDGVTTFKDTGEEIKSVANRALFFNSKYPHCSSTTTDQNGRITLNFNYF